MTSKKWNALVKKALSFGLSQTKKMFRKFIVLGWAENDGELASASFRLEVGDPDGNNREFITVKIEHGEIRNRKVKESGNGQAVQQ